ncbi:hypothetical protein ACIPUP_07565 [Pectobacterium actinidiae]|uniref:Uncharacterized protein n=1 Tax=Pectobacterium actinidiae TaxID=1507808 RepID=A0ABW8G8M0_9GAMM
MNTLTNERLEKYSQADVNSFPALHHFEISEMAKRLLAAEAQVASLESTLEREREKSRRMGAQLAELRGQEPVAWRSMRHGPNAYVVTLSKTVADSWAGKKWPIAPLYTHPVPPAASQPYTVSIGGVTAEHQRVIEMLLKVCGAAFELADDTCECELDGEQCITAPIDSFAKLSDALDEIENTLPTEDADRPDVFLAWAAMPRAALKSLFQLSGNSEQVISPVIPDGYCIMPLKLTAENGAKGTLSGEFHISHTVTCHECGGEGCEDCNDRGSWEEEILIGWDIIKQIYQSAVDACSKTDKASS